ncbi:MAG: site-specific DNA-methyltransferase [Proteobacteria bacterium]|nr:MAG: site-specific DNA-methyltransferase [Pseudomonadota bacterium]
MVNFGDKFQIGRHTLLCGDSTEKAMVSALLEGKEPVLMITDPPYGVKFTVRNRHDAGAKASPAESLEQIRVRNDHRTNWSKSFLLSKARIAYIWHPSSASDMATQAIRDAGYDPRQSIIWLKNRAILSRSAYHWRHESSIYAVKEGETANWKGDRKQTTVWEANVPTPKDRIHPTQKPVCLYTKPIENHTDAGDLIFDPFAGSGTIFAAAEETGREALGIELDQALCEKIIERMRGLGLETKLIGNIFES